MKKYLIVLLLGIPLLVAAQTSGVQPAGDGQPFSLEALWKAAEANSRKLKLSDLEVQQSRLEILEAKDRLLPELSVGGDLKLNSQFLIYDQGLFSTPQDVPIKSYGYAAGYSLNYTLFNGGSNKRNVLIKKEESIRKGYESELQKHNVKYNIAVAYFDLYKLLSFKDLLQAEIETEKKQFSLIESLHKNGTVLKSDVLRTSVKLSQLELNLSDIHKKIELSKEKINILTGRDPETKLEIDHKDAIEINALPNTSYDDYLNTALSSSPEYKMVNSEIKQRALNVKQVSATRSPKVLLYSNYNYTYPQLSFYPYSNDLWGFGQTGIKVQFSIDNLYKSKHTLARARLINEEAKEKAALKKDDILLQVKEAYLQRQQAQESVAIAQQNIKRTTEALRVIKSSYLNQESLLTDLLEAENALLSAKFDLTTAHTGVQISHIRLLAITGTL